METNDCPLWKNEEHRRRFVAFASAHCRSRPITPADEAALYLLSSDPALLWRMRYGMYRADIDFDHADLTGISPEQYAVYKAAKCLYLDSGEVGIDELADGELFDAEEYALIENAIRIKRYGMESVW